MIREPRFALLRIAMSAVAVAVLLLALGSGAATRRASTACCCSGTNACCALHGTAPRCRCSVRAPLPPAGLTALGALAAVTLVVQRGFAPPPPGRFAFALSGVLSRPAPPRSPLLPPPRSVAG